MKIMTVDEYNKRISESKELYGDRLFIVPAGRWPTPPNRIRIGGKLIKLKRYRFPLTPEATDEVKSIRTGIIQSVNYAWMDFKIWLNYVFVLIFHFFWVIPMRWLRNNI